MAGSFDRRSDRELVELCNRGSRDEAVQAFESLYRRHRDYVTRVALRFGGDREAAVDVLQETFLYLLKKFPPSGEGLVLTAQLRSLLYPVAKNLTLSFLRRQRAPGRYRGLRSGPVRGPGRRRPGRAGSRAAVVGAGPSLPRAPGSGAAALCRRHVPAGHRRHPLHSPWHRQVPAPSRGQGAAEQPRDQGFRQAVNLLAPSGA